ncbi:hypothetical protein SAMN06272765_1545 [Streptomyces sp. Ag109_G2-15]|nr:hypothetical protein SAMN06272765_1545 [Streptomyces sp. Ag109_G2-15]
MGDRLVTARRMMAEAVGGAAPEHQLMEAARGLVAELGAPDFLPELITELASGAGETAACASRSYGHVLGFQKLLLIDDGPGQKLRAHVWQPISDSAGREQDIHNHRSPIASCVVRGRLSMELYEPSADGGIDIAAYQESLSVRDADWMLAPRGPARLRLAHTAHYARGASYALAAHTLHRAWCGAAEGAVTLLLETGSERLAHTDVYSPSTSHAARVRKVPLTEDEYLTALTALSGTLGP